MREPERASQAGVTLPPVHFKSVRAYVGERSISIHRNPAMADRIASNLIYEILKDVQARLARLEGMRGEMREGFALLEKDMERVKRRLELAEKS
jgi:hypothetical protein